MRFIESDLNYFRSENLPTSSRPGGGTGGRGGGFSDGGARRSVLGIKSSALNMNIHIHACGYSIIIGRLAIHESF